MQVELRLLGLKTRVRPMGQKENVEMVKTLQQSDDEV